MLSRVRSPWYLQEMWGNIREKLRHSDASWSWSRLTHLPMWLPGSLSEQEPCLTGKQRRNCASPGHLGTVGEHSPHIVFWLGCCFLLVGSGHLLLPGAQREQRWLPWRWWSTWPQSRPSTPEPTRGSSWTLVKWLLSSGHGQPQSSWHPREGTGSEMSKQALGIVEVTGNCGTFCTNNFWSTPSSDM